MNCKLLMAVMAAAALVPSFVRGAPHFLEDFEVDPTANWTINGGTVNDKADLFFDYGALGIPAPLGSSGTRGLKLVANLNGTTLTGVNVSPAGQDFGLIYKLKFDWWASYNIPGQGFGNTVGAGGAESTQLSTFGVGTDGTSNQKPGVASSVWFAATGSGNSSIDWRAFSSAASSTSGYAPSSGVFAAGTASTVRNNSDAYYSSFGGVSAPDYVKNWSPAPQTATGQSLVGAPAWEWHKVEIEKSATSVTWTVDGLPIATVPLAGLTLSGNNFFLGHSDINALSGSLFDPNIEQTLFTLIDNVVVVPEPSSLRGCWFAGLVASGFWRRRS